MTYSIEEIRSALADRPRVNNWSSGMIESLLSKIDVLLESNKIQRLFFNQIYAHSTGCSVMAEEDVSEIFRQWSELQDKLKDL